MQIKQHQVVSQGTNSITDDVTLILKRKLILKKFYTAITSKIVSKPTCFTDQGYKSVRQTKSQIVDSNVW
jgi:hypothetical protein